MEVARGVHRLTRGIVNFYLVEDRGALLLIDAGAPSDWGLLASTLDGRGRTVQDLDAVLLTHAHSDHIGFAERARTTAGAPVWVHREDSERAKGAKPGRNDGRAASYLLRPAFYRTTFSLLRRGAGRLIPVREVSTFSNGETIDVPGRPRAVHGPGHTAGSCALLFEDRSLLLSGDVLVTWNPLTGRAGPQIMPSAFNADTTQALRSLGVLEGLRVDVVLPGHGDPWTGGAAEAVRLARAAGPS